MFTEYFDSLIFAKRNWTKELVFYRLVLLGLSNADFYEARPAESGKGRLVVVGAYATRGLCARRLEKFFRGDRGRLRNIRVSGRGLGTLAVHCRPAGFLATLLTLFILGAATLLGTGPAQAGCSLVATTVTCTGTLPGTVIYSAPTVGDLEVNTITAGTSLIQLGGVGAAVGNGTNAVEFYTCSITGTAGGGSTAASCTINNGVQPPTCTSDNGNQGQTATCVLHESTPATSGPSGQSGPNVTINVVAPTSGPVTIGAGRADYAVKGFSFGSNGGNGGSGGLAGDGGNGGNGVDGGTVSVNFTGVIPSAAGGGILAESAGGNGGNGGSPGVLGGSGGQGGAGGFGGTAAISFNGGSITTTGDGSIGALAMSLGGAGGSGGGGFGLFYSAGGSGNTAGQGGPAQVTTLAGTTIITSGNFADGIAALSIGGGGGGGGGGFGTFYSGGGGGGTGGNGGAATVNAAGSILTLGQYAHGILAQSIGGGGGSASSSAGLVAIGGSGAAGGDGGTADVTNSGLVITQGFGSVAIEAQSIGGGGGNGANSGGLVAIGGDGSNTSPGGTVSVTNTGTLVTYSSQAEGILAQSIGGGGGNGGTSGGLFSFGGSGGGGGDGNTVSVTNGGDITTGSLGGTTYTGGYGSGVAASPGILAQSIGGGGGNGGGAISVGVGAAVSFGGSGGAGGDGKAVNVFRDNANSALATAYDITTYGDTSSAISAQSIGGGGGNGGFAVAASVGTDFSVSIGVGGAGAGGGSAGTVGVDTKGTLTTYGLNSDGILAQSLGGGGGNGGFSVAASVSLGASIGVAVGGTAGGGGSASAVDVSSLSDINTYNANSYGIAAQSIGGGGGNGGFAVAATGGIVGVSVGVGGGGGTGGGADSVGVTSVGNIYTAGVNSDGIAAQSIGGGGGNGGFSVAAAIGAGGIGVGVGGSGTAGGTASTATVDSSGSIITINTNSTGILAQSLGGGGGNGGFAASGTIGVAGAASIGVGGSGGGGQTADEASVYADGGGTNVSVGGYGSGWNVVTLGGNSAGIEAQSIGGGGGNGGFAGTLALSSGVSIGVSLGGSGGDGSAAGEALVESGYGRAFDNNIFTYGDNSSGIVAQSIGGGGGNGGFAVSLSGSIDEGGAVAVTLGGSGGNGSTGGIASAYSVGDITTVGNVSDGVLAQSIGGGGGNGGFSVALSATAANFGGAVAIGGSGGTGNNSSAVTLNSDGTIITFGQQSNGLIAQSIGGGGGNGGFAGAGALSLSGVGIAVGVGGSGSGGGGASTVDLTNTGDVTTAGNQSSAIVAQSIGGGGGNGGSTVGLSLSALGGASVNVGGAAGAGGSSSDVTVVSTGNLTTGYGSSAAGGSNNAYGILAQSLGGGGGNGGFSGNLTAGGAVGIGVSVGGLGGAGGDAGIVEATSTGNIATVFDNSGGILAQSIGGGGGNGGFSVSVAASASIEDIGVAAAVSVGGFGGTAGMASDVSATSTGTVLTKGYNSNGIAAQSIGGGGGNGGFSVAGGASLGQAGIGVSVGGFGAGGGSAGTAEVDSYGAGYQVVPTYGVTTLETDGDLSNGILAQSLGGGGGNGGFSVGVGVAADGAGVAVSVGGFGAGGGAADSVGVISYNNILTKGLQSNAIEAQSLGGGGGNGGFAGALSGGTDFSGSIAVGGFALSGGGDASTVTVNSFGALQTLGVSANGILAQSIGGGGGNGGFALSGAFSLGTAGLSASLGGFGSNGGLGADVIVNSNVGATLSNNNATIETSGQSANGIEAQSIGGGGGNGGFSGGFTATMNAQASLALSVGGFGAAGNSAGSVGVTSVDNILTQNDGSNGILAQSIGGGGGEGGFSFAGTVSVPTGNSFSMSASLGGFGGSGGDAGSVTVNSTGIISTTGNNASGTVAQSLGGGGGNGGLSVAGTFNFASQNNVPSITASVGGFGGSGGAADVVNVTRTGATQTIGDLSYGLLAQSIGGGGGNGGLSVAGSIGGPDAKQISASVGGFGGPGSNAADVTVHNTGAITTGSVTMQQEQLAQLGTVFATVKVVTGTGSDGILAQSIGGGGGNGGFAFSGTVGPTGEKTSVNVGLTVGGFGGGGGTAGNVNVTNDGLVTTYGAAANGIEAQSLGGGGGNGGSALTGLLAAGDPQAGGKAVNVAVSVGGFGGNGNVAGNVFVEQAGGIVTSGAGSDGILAQSIGGGGGTGGGANSLSLQLGTSCTFTIPFGLKEIKGCQAPKSPSVNVQVDVGGGGGTGNDGGLATVINHSFITTTGEASSGIVAQSIGGGGGNGGQAIVGLTGLFPGASYVDIGLALATLPVSTTGFVQGLGRVTVGGFGGAAGDGKAVNVTNDGVIQTSGISSYGIEAQSLGGGGGNGGDASSGVTGAVNVGGFGAASGAGGAVTVTNNAGANIVTTGASGDAIFAQSVGGGGGNGGAAGALIAVGGFGGASGSGGTVEVDNSAALETSGVQAVGILAQSIGGGGGNGGGTGLSAIAVGGLAGVLGSTGDGGAVTVNNTSAAFILTTGASANGIEAQSIGGGGGKGGGNTLAAAVTVGGHGGSAGDGGKVTINNDGVVVTEGDDSIGVFGESIGGSGGDGGGSIVSLVTVGGYGGSSGNGGEVDIANTNLVVTFGSGSDAVRGQSIGGGGGNAGGVGEDLTSGGLGLGLLVSVGGSGGGAGDGGVVDVTNSAFLQTVGDKSNGIYAQSIGGGGGDGGRAIGLVAVGGSGGNSGNGGSVTVTNDIGGDIWTQGTMSDGIFAQSIGGGGGNGGGAYSGSPIGFSTSVGGSGAGGGNGGMVTVDNYASVETDGLSSEAVFAQSVGGGGGNGGIAGSFNLQAVPATPAVGVGVGGNGGSGGDGGAVNVTNYSTGSIITNGANSTAIFAQSVGGGGGNGGYAMSVSASLAGSVAVSVGGSGGAAGDGGTVNVSNDGLVVINGNNSIGIMAQSVGGGGGTAADALGVAIVPVFIGGQSGANGIGGDVSVTNSGSMFINGNDSIGIFAQSVGGGGGMVKPGGGASSVTAEAGGTGDGGTVTIDNTAGAIIINGDNSIAIYSQSVGGGGGAVGLNDNAPGQIGAFLFSGTAGGAGQAMSTVFNQTGDLAATGLNSIGLVGQSQAPGGNGDITINISNPAGSQSLILGGLGSGAGVYILDGGDNLLNNDGAISGLPKLNFNNVSITSVSSNDGTVTITPIGGGTSSIVSGTLGYAVRATGGNDRIVNTGLIMGSVDLGTGLNGILNTAAGVFDTGVTVAVGPGNLATNDGLLSPGGFQNIITTNLTGNYLQDASGTLGIDLDLDPSTDILNVSGTAVLSGRVFVNLVDPLTAPGYALPGNHEELIVSAAGGVTNAGLTLHAFDTAVVKYALAYPNKNDVDLTYVIDYAPSGLTKNQRSIGETVNAIQAAQKSPAFRAIATNLFYLPDVSTLGGAYDSLSGEGAAGVQQTAFDSNDNFMNTIGDQIGGWLQEPQRSIDHPWHLWLTPYNGSAQYPGDANAGSAHLSDSGYGFGLGIDRQILPSAVLGAAIGVSESWFNVSGRQSNGSLQGFHAGLYGGWHSDLVYVTGTVSYNNFNNLEHRLADIPSVTLPASYFIDGPYIVPGFEEFLSGRSRASSIGGQFEAGYRGSVGIFDITPYVGLNFGALHLDPFTEKNGSSPSLIGLSFASQNVTSLPSFVGVQFDTTTEVSDTAVLRSWLRAAWKHEFDTSRVTEASFVSAPGYEFSVQGAEPPADAAVARIGVEMIVQGNVSIFASVNGELGKGTHSYSGTGGMKIAF